MAEYEAEVDTLQIEMQTLKMSCVDEVEMGMMISWNSSWRNESSSVGKCEVLVDGNDDDTMTKLGCSADIIITFLQSSDYTFQNLTYG
jgi:hypothetical protein